jgi:uncharacterized phage protein (TIGR01671 family)
LTKIRFRVWTLNQTIGRWELQDVTGNRIYLHELDVIMQYTGVFDKHGKEICDGDIVSQEYVDDIDDNFKTTLAKRIGMVYWAQGHGGFAIEWTDEQCDFTLNIPNLEIIGNTCKNLELLARKKQTT